MVNSSMSSSRGLGLTSLFTKPIGVYFSSWSASYNYFTVQRFKMLRFKDRKFRGIKYYDIWDFY